MKPKTLKPIYIPLLFIVVALNFILSSHFIVLFFIGVVFKIFLEVIRGDHFYMFFVMIGTFSIIEATQGFYLFSLSLSTILIYYFIIARLKHILSSPIFAEFFYLLIFYAVVYLIHSFHSQSKIEMGLIFLGNFLIDLIIIGLFV